MRRPSGRRTVRNFLDAERGIWELQDFLSWREGQIVTVEGAGSATSVGVPHTLGYVPEHFEIVSQNGDGSLWHDDDDDWTNATVAFRGTSGVTFTVRIR